MLLRQTLLYLPAQILSPLVQFASVLVWSHLLAPQSLGTVTLLVAIQEVCYMAFFGWWSLSTLRFISSFEGAAERAPFLKTESLAIIGCVVAQSLLLALLLPLVLGQTLSPQVLALSIAFMLTRSLNNYTADRARAEAQIALYSMVQIIGPVIGFLFGLFCIWRFGPAPSSVLAGFVVAQSIGIVIGLIRSDLFRSFGRGSRTILKRAISFGSIQTGSQLLAILAMNAPRFIVSTTLGLTALGMFSVGYSLGLRASSFAVTLVTAGAYPLVVRKMNSEGAPAAFTQLSKNMILVALTVAPVAFGLLGINRSVVDMLVAAPYREVTYVVLPLATLGGLFRYLRAHTSDQVFLLNLKPQIGTIVAACDIVVAVASVYVGIHVFGVKGAALGPMVSGLATFTLSFALSRLLFGFRAPLGTIGRIMLAAAIMGGAIWLLPVTVNPLILSLYVGVGGMAYVVLIILFLPRERQTLVGLIDKFAGKFGLRKARKS